MAIASNDVCTNQGFKSVIPNDNVDSLFLYYLLKYNKMKIEALAGGTTFKEVSGSTMKNVEVYMPDNLKEQKRIADILGRIDDKIELNTKINNNLEQQLLILYKNRFIDMAPFNGSMPNDWHQGTVSEIIELHDFKRIPLSSRMRAKLAKVYPYYGATSIMDYVDNYLFDGIYLLLAEDGTVINEEGFPIVQYVDGKFWVNNHAHIITGKNGYSVEALYLLFMLTNVKSFVTGAVQPKISQTNLKKIPIIIPSEPEIKKFDLLIQPIFAQIRNYKAENNLLSNLRDSLLPLLMSGKLDISNIIV